MKRFSREWWFWNVATVVGGAVIVGTIWFVVSSVIVIANIAGIH